MGDVQQHRTPIESGCISLEMDSQLCAASMASESIYFKGQ